MPAAARADPELIRPPGLTGYRVLHLHLIATPLAADLQFEFNHVAGIVAPGGVVEYGPVIPAIILAAGASSRMGRTKALLPLPRGDCFLLRLEATLRAAGVEEIIAVIGHDAAAIRAAIEGQWRDGANAASADRHGSDPADTHARNGPFARPATPRLRLAENPDPSRGQLSSLLVGLDAVIASARSRLEEKGGLALGGFTPPGILVTTVDLPLVSPDTVGRVVAAWQATGAPIVRPARGKRHGHPVIFGGRLYEELRAADPGGGARTVVRAHEAEAVDVPVNDPGAFDDIDTPDDYERMVGLPFLFKPSR